MAVRHDDLSPEEQARQRALDRSWRAAREALSDQDFRARLEESIDRVNGSALRPITSKEFLAQSEPATE